MAQKDLSSNYSRFGIILIVVGVLLLLAKFDFLGINLWLSLQILSFLVIAAGAFLLLGKVKGGIVALLILGAGGLFFSIQVPKSLAQFQKIKLQTIEESLENARKAEVTVLPSVANLSIKPLNNDKLFISGKIETIEGENLDSRYKMDNGRVKYYLETNKRNRWSQVSKNIGLNWDILLNPNVELDLFVRTRVGKSKLDLLEFDLSKLRIETGVGDAEITLPNRGDFKARIETGVGDMIVRVPKTLAIKISLDSGMGEVNIDDSFEKNDSVYYSQNYSDADKRVELKIKSRVGEITIESF